MSVTFDGQTIFDSQELTLAAGSQNRASVERAVAGLDGMLSIDMGLRPRRIRQRGVLRAPSHEAMTARLESIMAFIDGRTHTLVTANGYVYDNLRMDSFQRTGTRAGGPGVIVEYEIVYTQLGE